MNIGTLIKKLIAAFVLIVAAHLTPALAQVGDNVVAIVDGKTILQSEVDAVVTAQLFPLQQQMYASQDRSRVSHYSRYSGARGYATRIISC